MAILPVIRVNPGVSGEDPTTVSSKRIIILLGKRVGHACRFDNLAALRRAGGTNDLVIVVQMPGRHRLLAMLLPNFAPQRQFGTAGFIQNETGAAGCREMGLLAESQEPAWPGQAMRSKRRYRCRYRKAA